MLCAKGIAMRDEPPIFPDQETLEKELSDYLSRKYGYRIKVISPMMAAEHSSEPVESVKKTGGIENIRFDMKPEEMESYLNQYVIRQDEPKAILATKICTHYNRIRYLQTLARFENSDALLREVFPYSEVPYIVFDGKSVPMQPAKDFFIRFLDTAYPDIIS